MEIPIFFDEINDAYVDASTYAFLHNKNKTKKILIETVLMEKSHTENFEGKTYYGYSLTLVLPDITIVDISDLYVTLYHPSTQQTFYLGEIYLQKTETKDTIIDIKSLEGTKDMQNHLKQITIESFNDFFVDEVMVGNQMAKYDIYDHKIIITIETKNLYYHDPYIEIKLANQIQMIHNFNYFSQYDLMKTGKLTPYYL